MSGRGWLGATVHLRDRVDSTSDELWRMSTEEDTPHGTVVLARAQDRGRGRQGRSWASPPGGGLYLSFLLRPGGSVAPIASFSLVVALELARHLHERMGITEVGLKWPNDVWIGRSKVAGVLLEARSTPDVAVVVGVGLNLRRPPAGWGALEGRAIALDEVGVEVEPQVLLGPLLALWGLAYDRHRVEGFAPRRGEWDRYCLLRDAMVSYEDGGVRRQGRARGVDDAGRLRLVDDRGRASSLGSGEVHVVGIGR